MNKIHIDLLLSYTWEYDEEFAERVNKIFSRNNLSTLIFNKRDIDKIVSLINEGNCSFGAYLDRASDVDEDFNIISGLLKETSTYLINPMEIAEKVVDKAYMHPLLSDSGITLPMTFIIPPYDKYEKIELNEYDLDKIGRPFIIKPCYYTGGGEGVITDAFSLEDVLEIRKLLPDDNYLVQQKIYPTLIEDKRAWFRILWAFGEILITQWDDIEHIYSELKDGFLDSGKIEQMKNIAHRISSLCNLDYFSTEIALTENDGLYVIDYVNDQCDMRLQSKHPDGVPDELVDRFIQLMIDKIVRA